MNSVWSSLWGGLFFLSFFVMNGGAAPVACSSLRMELDGENRGAVSRVSTASGVEFSALSPSSLFRIVAFKKSEPTKSLTFFPEQASTFDMKPLLAGGYRLVYKQFPEAIDQVVCTVRPKVDRPALIDWNLSVRVRAGWTLEKVFYPCISLRSTLGTVGADDAFVAGTAKGGIYRAPGANAKGWTLSWQQPGSLAAQFMTYLDGEAGFYFAAEDETAQTKNLLVKKETENSLFFTWGWNGCVSGEFTLPYPVVTGGFEGSAGRPADWRDAADLYKQWAVTRPWCQQKIGTRADLPKWMRDAPAMVRFQRDWLRQPELIRGWIKNFREHYSAEAPLIAAFWGWEKRAYWVTPDYFPVYPTDEAFRAIVAELRANGAHAFPWPSGYHWTLAYDKRQDGSFVWDDTQRFSQIAESHAVHNRDGKLYLRFPSWLRGGRTACLCAGDPWTIRWWNEEICLPLARLGCEMIQVDQVVGGAFPPCWRPDHPHAPGNGEWKSQVFAEQLKSMLRTMRAVEPDSVVCFEEPNEQFNHLVGVQDYRNCEYRGEWASVFSYLYHEYLPLFQSNPHRGDAVMEAHCAVDGQIPHLTPVLAGMAGMGLLRNGNFEMVESGDHGFVGWDRLSGYNGKKWDGKWAVDRTIKRDGASALRLENRKADVVQVSQNVQTADACFQAGRKYRLRAWLKTGKMVRPNGIQFGLFAPGLKRLGGGTLSFPKAEEGWQQRSADFVLPSGMEMIRIMIHLNDEAVAWVDGMELLEVDAQGNAQPLRSTGRSTANQFMMQWVKAYHGEGRAWLAFGRMIRPPRLLCAKRTYRGGEVPAVAHNAFVAENGTRRVALANTTDARQPILLEQDGTTLRLTLEPNELRLIPWEGEKK